MKRILSAIAVAMLLSACGGGHSTPNNNDDDSLVPMIVHAPGNHTLLCVKYTTVNRGGLWCEDITGKDTP